MQKMAKLSLTLRYEDLHLMDKLAHEDGVFRNQIVRDGIALIAMLREYAKEGKKVMIEGPEGKHELKLL
jgi:hypothetical protein